MRRALILLSVLVLFASIARPQSLGGTHTETGIVQGAFSGGIFNFYIQHPYTPNCGQTNVTLYLNIGDPSRPIPAGAVVTVSGRIVGNGASPGASCLAPLLHVANLTVVQ